MRARGRGAEGGAGRGGASRRSLETGWSRARGGAGGACRSRARGGAGGHVGHGRGRRWGTCRSRAREALGDMSVTGAGGAGGHVGHGRGRRWGASATLPRCQRGQRLAGRHGWLGVLIGINKLIGTIKHSGTDTFGWCGAVVAGAVPKQKVRCRRGPPRPAPLDTCLRGPRLVESRQEASLILSLHAAQTQRLYRLAPAEPGRALLPNLPIHQCCHQYLYHTHPAPRPAPHGDSHPNRGVDAGRRRGWGGGLQVGDRLFIPAIYIFICALGDFGVGGCRLGTGWRRASGRRRGGCPRGSPSRCGGAWRPWRAVSRRACRAG